MSTYVFSINNYNPIKTASIKLDGITVLAGINGCGKSTISRWIYYLVNGMHDFEKKQSSYLINSLISRISRVDRLFRIFSGDTKYREYIEKFQNLENDIDFDESKLANLFEAFTRQAKKDLSSFIKTASSGQKRRMSYYLANKQDIDDYDELVNSFINSCDVLYNTRIEEYHTAILIRNLSDLKDTIQNEYDEHKSMPKNIHFEEDGVSLISKDQFSNPLMLNRAIYIDTPMVISDQMEPAKGKIWDHFLQLIENNNKRCDKDEFLQFLIRKSIGGTVELIKDDIGYSQKLYYIRQDDPRPIKLTDAATGIKTFAYMLRLLENEWLDEETILLIDEPEAHLHPQWIVEFARILVLLSKKLGTKIVLACHNPDMVAAIQSISEREQMSDQTHFYLAEPVAGSSQYNFVDKGNEIGDIFESFNIAMSRIEQYGTPLL